MSKKAKVNDTLYPVKDLMDNCEALTGYKKEVAVGALFNCEKIEMSKIEFKDYIDKFLKTKVNKEG